MSRNFTSTEYSPIPPFPGRSDLPEVSFAFSLTRGISYLTSASSICNFASIVVALSWNTLSISLSLSITFASVSFSKYESVLELNAHQQLPICFRLFHKLFDFFSFTRTKTITRVIQILLSEGLLFEVVEEWKSGKFTKLRASCRLKLSGYVTSITLLEFNLYSGPIHIIYCDIFIRVFSWTYMLVSEVVEVALKSSGPPFRKI